MFSQVSVCPQSASLLLVHCWALLWRGGYASDWNAVLCLVFVKVNLPGVDDGSRAGLLVDVVAARVVLAVLVLVGLVPSVTLLGSVFRGCSLGAGSVG